jgi:hypothetical protein
MATMKRELVNTDPLALLASSRTSDNTSEKSTSSNVINQQLLTEQYPPPPLPPMVPHPKQQPLANPVADDVDTLASAFLSKCR